MSLGRRRLGGALGAVVVAGVLVSIAATHTAAAGDPLQVFTAFRGGLKGPLLSSYALTDLVAGNANPSNQRGGTPQPVGPVAVTTDGNDVVFGAQVNINGAIVPEIGVEDIATRAVTEATPSSGTVLGLAVDPAHTSTVYVLESNGIDRLNVAASPPTATSLNVQFQSAFAPESMVISPDGATLYVGEDDDGTGGVQSFSVGNPGITTFWDGRNSVPVDGITLEGVFDVAMAPNGSALYVSGSGGNAAGASESEVLALSLRPFLGNENPIWAKGLAPGTAGGIQLADPNSLTVNPGGQTVFAGGTNGPGANSSVQAFAASNGAPGANGSVSIVESGNDSGGLASIAISPDGQHVLAYGQNVTNGGDSDDIVALNSSDLHVVGTSVVPTSARAVPDAPQSIAITPAQIPLPASFSVNVAQAGAPTTFSASQPNAGVPGISYTYTWLFGDGAAGSGQTVNHIFATSNTYSVTLTVRGLSPAGSNVDTAGQTPFWRTLPGTSTQNVNIPVTPPPPTTPHTTTTKKVYHPSLAVNPKVGPPGTIVTITGKGFPPNAHITVSWSLSSGSIMVTTDPHGNLGPTQLPILIPDVLGQRFAVASGTPAAKAAFLVVPGTAEPGGSQGIYLFRSDGP